MLTVGITERGTLMLSPPLSSVFLCGQQFKCAVVVVDETNEEKSD